MKDSLKFILSLTGTNAEKGYEYYQENGLACMTKQNKGL